LQALRPLIAMLIITVAMMPTTVPRTLMPATKTALPQKLFQHAHRASPLCFTPGCRINPGVNSRVKRAKGDLRLITPLNQQRFDVVSKKHLRSLPRPAPVRYAAGTSPCIRNNNEKNHTGL
jgi:hypothetical protein